MASTGWLSPGTTSSTGWTDPNNVFASDDARATITQAAAGETAYFRAYNFGGISVPAGATNIRIEARMEGQITGVADYSYWFVGHSSGSPQSVSTRAISLPVAPGGLEAYATMGSSSDNWGGVDTDTNGTYNRDWLPSDFNSSFMISGAWGTTTGITVSLDHVQVNIHYTVLRPSLLALTGVS